MTQKQRVLRVELHGKVSMWRLVLACGHWVVMRSADRPERASALCDLCPGIGIQP